MDKKFIGIVINKIDYKEKDNLINIFSPSEGLITCKLKGVKGATSKLKVLSSPFCFAEFTAVQTNDKVIITGGEVVDTFFEITKDIEKYYAGFCILDFIKQILKYEFENFDLLFKVLVNFLKALCYLDLDSKIALIKCLLELTTISGFNLNLQTCLNCNNILQGDVYIDLTDNGVKCEKCASKRIIHITKECFNVLKTIQDKNYENLHIEVKGETLKEVLTIIGNYIYCTFDYTIKIKELLNSYWL